MASSTPIRFLEKAGTGTGFQPDDFDLALKMFSGVVLEAFYRKTVFWDDQGTVMAVQQLNGGKSHQWPIFGRDNVPTYHEPGTELLGQTFKMDEGIVTVDNILVDHVDVAKVDITVSHFPVIEPIARKLGRSLAQKFDTHAAIIGLNAARTAAVSGIHDGGNQVTRVAASVAAGYPNSTTGANNFRDDVAQLAYEMDIDNVPEDGRYLYITPYIRQILSRHATDIFDRDYGPGSADNDLNSRRIGNIAGFDVMVTNGLPNTNVTVSGLTPSKYAIDARAAGAEDEPVALALCGAMEGSAAIGCVSAFGITPHMENDERRNTTFMKAQAMLGMGVLSPWCAGSIGVSTT